MKVSGSQNPSGMDWIKWWPWSAPELHGTTPDQSPSKAWQQASWQIHDWRAVCGLQTAGSRLSDLHARFGGGRGANQCLVPTSILFAGTSRSTFLRSKNSNPARPELLDHPRRSPSKILLVLAGAGLGLQNFKSQTGWLEGMKICIPRHPSAAMLDGEGRVLRVGNEFSPGLAGFGA